MKYLICLNMNIKRALSNNRLCKALTGLSVKEFEELVPQFQWNYEAYEHRRKPDRKRAIGGGRDSYIELLEEKLFYILFYLKVYPTFDMASFLVGFTRAQACIWEEKLLVVLEMSLKRKMVLPDRKIHSMEELLEKFPEIKEVFADGIERRRQRPVGKKKQNKTYSGKKKAHTRKNIVLVSPKKEILVLTKTKSGRRHDKRLADKEALFEGIPPNWSVFADTGFVGIEKVHPNSYIPKKRPPKGVLTSEEKEMNRLISSIRVVVEHAIGGIKRYGCVAGVYRNRKVNMDDTFILLASGLWNYHLQS